MAIVILLLISRLALVSYSAEKQQLKNGHELLMT